jgi:heptosyltransferase II
VVIPPERLVVLAPNWLGDAVMALPLMADLRRAWPETDVTVAARPAVARMFEMAPGVARTMVLEARGGLRVVGALQRNAASLAAGGFDAALLLPNSFQSALLVWRAGIQERWGYRRDLRARLLTRAMTPPAGRVHQAAYYQALGAGLGVPVGPPVARLDVSADHQASARRILRAAGLDEERRFVAVAPGAAYGTAKQWPPERFAQLAALLAEAGVATILVGARADVSACDAIVRLASTPDLAPRDRSDAGSAPAARPAEARGAPVLSVCGSTDIPALAGLLSMADAVVANDSGAMHLAAAVGAGVVAVFGPTDYRATSPLRASVDTPEPIVLAAPVWCRPCMLRECPIDHRCMTGISADEVFAAVSGSVAAGPIRDGSQAASRR